MDCACGEDDFFLGFNGVFFVGGVFAGDIFYSGGDGGFAVEEDLVYLVQKNDFVVWALDAVIMGGS